MNEYSDDFQQDKGSTSARAEDLINRSKQNLQKRADSPGQYAKNYREGTPLVSGFVISQKTWLNPVRN